MIVFMLYNLMSKFCNERSKQAETEKNTKLKNIKVWKKNLRPVTFGDIGATPIPFLECHELKTEKYQEQTYDDQSIVVNCR